MGPGEGGEVTHCASGDLGRLHLSCTWQEGRICWVERKGMSTLLCASEESFSGTPMRAYRCQGHFDKSGARAEEIGVSR